MSAGTVVEKTATLAAAAVAAYAADQRLDYHGLDVPHYGDAPAITIRATESAAARWVAALDDITEPEVRRPTEARPDRELVIHRGHLPTAIGGVPVEVWTSRKVVPLRLVGAGSDGVS